MTTVSPIKVSNDKIIEDIRYYLDLNRSPYSNIDGDLLLLAFTPVCDVETQTLLEKRYSRCNHDTLKIIGDKICIGTFTDILYEYVQLSADSGLYTKLMNTLMDSKTLTNIMTDREVCNLIRSPSYRTDKFPNYCSDSLKALVGAMFIHFSDHQMDFMELIKHWFLRSTALPFKIHKLFNSLHYKSRIPVYFYNDKEGIVSELPSTMTENDIADKCIILNTLPTISDIYTLLNWYYQGPLLNHHIYIIEGEPNGQRRSIGEGITHQIAINNAINFLKLGRYIYISNK